MGKNIFCALIIAGLCFGDGEKVKQISKFAIGITGGLNYAIYLDDYWPEKTVSAGKSWIQQKDGSQTSLVNTLLSNNEAKLESKSDTDSDRKLSIGLKAGIGYNSLLKSVVRDSTQQLIIGPFLQRKITDLLDVEFSISYQYFKSRDFGEGFTTIYYSDNLLIPIKLKFNCLKTSSITLNWNIGAETVIELDGDWELRDSENNIFLKGKEESLQKLFYLQAGIGGDVIVSSRIHLQIGTSLGYCLTTPIISRYPLRVWLGVMF